MGEGILLTSILQQEYTAKNKRSEILNMCAQFFYEKGYRGTSLDDVAKSLNITKPAIYYHFKNKEEILCELYAKAIDYLLENVVEVFGKDESSVSKLINMITMHLNVVTSNIPLITIFLQEKKELPMEDKRAISNKKKKYGDYFVQVLQKGMSEGEFITQDPFLLGQSMLGMCNGLLTWYEPKGKYSTEDVSESIISVILKGVIL